MQTADDFLVSTLVRSGSWLCAADRSFLEANILGSEDLAKLAPGESADDAGERPIEIDS